MNKLYLILVAIMIFVAVSLSGIFAPPFPQGENPTNPSEYKCCDTGNKDDCHPIKENGFTYNNERYNLLKSDIFLDYPDGQEIATGDNEDRHLDPAPGNNSNLRTPDGRRIFLNTTDRRGSDVYPQCVNQPNGNDGYDRLYGEPDPRNTGPGSRGKGCYKIPNDLLIYVCRTDSPNPADCDAQGVIRSNNVKFDAYIRQRDVDEAGGKIPYDIITDCYKQPLFKTDIDQKIVFRPSPSGQPNLQLRTFQFQSSLTSDWLTPYCKPAIYLYPERKTEINVSVFPQGKMLLTIPPYPKTGWDVVADPDGNIYSQGNRFDYLYYEASLPDQFITQPEQGYAVKYDERALFLTDLVTRLGLNEKETKQFVDYWVPILPKSPYYFVGVVSEKKLNELSPLIITPKPAHVIRVTLYFKPLEKKIPVTPPLILPVSRDGYTAVEWGGIFKQDKNHPFSCFM